MTKPQAYILVGVPNSGKTTFRKEQDLDSYRVISSDDYIEEEAKSKDTTYNIIFNSYVNKAIDLMYEDLDDAIFNLDNIIWDQTNLTIKKRELIFRKIPKSVYDIHAVVFDIEEEEIRRRNKLKSGRNLSDAILNSMINRLEIPDESEGFKTVTIIGE